ncbi:MAG: hypothetical protein V7731_12255 [Amphritea sp.]
MARTTSYILDATELEFAKDFVLKQIRKGAGFGGDQHLEKAFDGMDMALRKVLSGRGNPARAVDEFAVHLRIFNEHEHYKGIVAKLRNGLRVRKYRLSNGSRKASDKTITISHESWALLKTVIRHGGAKTLSEAILKLDMPVEVIEQMRQGQARNRHG